MARWLTAAGVALALLVPAAANGQTETDLPVGEAKGVRLVRPDGGSVVLIFSQRSAKLRERINSPYAWLACTHLGDLFSSESSGNLDIPRHGLRVRTGIDPGPADYCVVFLRAHTVKRNGERRHVARRVLFSIPLTQAGAVYLDEASKTAEMLAVGLLADFAQEKKKLPGPPTYDQLVQAYPKVTKVVVALPAPGDSPPPKRVGYYSDGQEHIVLAVLSGSGKRLFIERSAGNVLTTNVAAHMVGTPF